MDSSKNKWPSAKARPDILVRLYSFLLFYVPLFKICFSDFFLLINVLSIYIVFTALYLQASTWYQLQTRLSREHGTNFGRIFAVLNG